MAHSFLFIVDSLKSLNPYKDTSLAIMKAFQNKGATTYICDVNDLYITNNEVYVSTSLLRLPDNYQEFDKGALKSEESMLKNITEFKAVFMRKDPPVDDSYYICTQILSFAEAKGVKIVNPPQTLRDFNEKIFALYFKDIIPKYVFTNDFSVIKEFANKHEKIILKPIDGMGGKGIFLSHAKDVNLSVIFETLTFNGKTPIMVQRFIPEVTNGDKRILILNGKVFPYGLSRIPVGDSVRGNLAAGGRYETRELNAKETEIAEKVAKFLKDHKIDLCGIDVIGDYLTEINITSPTCFVEISKFCGRDIAGEFILPYL